jgi:dihydrofolate synthase/folylpolyglutamate synthase
VLTLPIDCHDCRTPEELSELATKLGLATRAHRSISDALIGIRKRARVLVFGSLYLAGEALSLNGTLPD